MRNGFKVDVDITYSVSVYVEAENEEEAKSLAEEKVCKCPSAWLKNYGAIANVEAYDVDKDISSFIYEQLYNPMRL